jgi:hypothetical protein
MRSTIFHYKWASHLTKLYPLATSRMLWPEHHISRHTPKSQVLCNRDQSKPADPYYFRNKQAVAGLHLLVRSLESPKPSS